MSSIRSDLRAYYDDEAATGRRTAPTGRRVELLHQFVDRIRSHDAASVIDAGAGPGSDASAFVDAGIAYVGVDLSPANAVLARSRGHLVIAASLFDLPFAAGSFDAGWSMSTLMHVPVADFDAAMTATLAPLRPAALIGIGQWGGDEREFEAERSGQRRLFSLRTADHNRELLERHVEVEYFEAWPEGSSGWEYHFAVVRR